MRVIASMIFSIFCLNGCAHPVELLEVSTLNSDKLGKKIGFAVLRAPDRKSGENSSVPVVVFLHGMGSDHKVFDEYGAAEAVVQAMENGLVPRAHMIFPNGERGFYLNWYDGTHPYETYILDEVIPQAEKLLGVHVNRAQRHIAGVSMGGVGALQIGLRHPERFATVSCLSGIVLDQKQAHEMMDDLLLRLLIPIKRIWGDGTDQAFSDSINAYKLLPGHPSRPSQKIFLAFGTREKNKITDTTRSFQNYLESHNIAHRMVVFDGAHKWKYWIPVIRDNLNYILKK